jgi:hypothetical protein
MPHYFAEDATDAVLFRNSFSINYGNLIKIIRTVFEKIALSSLWSPSDGFLFVTYNVDIHKALT